MNTLKIVSALLFLSACTTGCAEGSKSGSPEQGTASTEPSTKASALPGRTPSKTPVTPGEVIDFRGGKESSDTSEYAATESSFRVFGIEEGDGTIPATATIAEVGVWQTRQYKVGDALGRGLVVSKIDEDGVTLHGARADVMMKVGVDTALRVIRHDHDVAAQPLGKHRFALVPAAARAALETVPAQPTTEAVTVYDKPMLKLGPVPPNGLWAAADFREGDLIAGVDGEAPSLDAIQQGLTDGRTKLEVLVYRGGVDLKRTYEVPR